jgi:hypothetical protein
MRTEASHQRTEGAGRKEDRGFSHKSSRSSPPSIHREAAAVSSGGRESRPGPSRGSPPPTEASRKKSRLESPGGPSPEASEVTIVKTVTRQPQKKENKKRLIIRSPMVITNVMLPTRHWHIKDGKLTYRPNQETVFECSTTLKAEKTWARTISFPLRPIGLVDSLFEPAKLPVPQGKNDTLKDLVRHPGMMLLPRPRYEECHSGRCSCVVHGMKDVHHRTSVLHDVCLRDGALSEKDLAVESRLKNFVENPHTIITGPRRKEIICWASLSPSETMGPGLLSPSAPSSPTAPTGWPPSSTSTSTARNMQRKWPTFI